MQLARWALLVGLLALVANLSVAEDLESFVNDLEEEDTPAGVDEMDDVSDEERQADELLDDLSENMMKRKGFRFGRSVKAVRNLSRSKSWYLRRAALLARQAHIRRVKRVVKTRKVIKKRSFKKLAKKALKARKNRKARQAKRAAAKARRAKRLAALRAGAKKIAKPRAAVQRLQASAARIRAHLKRVKAAYRKVSAKRRELKKNDAYLLKIAGKFKLKGKKLPSAFAKKMRGIKSQLAALNNARNAIAKRYRVAARALGKANRLLGAAVKRLRKAAKPFQPKVKKVRRRARKVQSKLAKYVKMLRKKGFKWYLGRLKQVMRLHNIQKNNKWKPMLRRLASRIYRVGRLAFGPFGRLGLSKGKLVLRKPLPKKKPAPKKPKKVVKKAKKPTKKAVRKAIRKAKKVLKKAKKPAAKKPSAKKVQAKSAPRVSIDGCFKSCDLLKKQIARDDALREKELKVLKFVRAKMIYLSTLKPEEDISEKEDIEMAQLLEALDITRKHAEIVGHGGVLKLLKQLQDRLNKEHTDAHASLRNRRKGCAAACAAAYKQKKAHKDKALQAKRTMRKRLYGVSKSLNKARGAAKAAAANYASDQKRHVVNNARIKREMGLIGQLTSKLDELEGIKTGELQMSDSDMLTALQEMRETRHDDADVRALLVEMTRASPATARVRVLLRALRAKLIKELSNSQRSLRKRFRAARHYNRQVKLLKMAQSGARTAHNLARRRLHSARHRLALVVKKCDGNVESE